MDAANRLRELADMVDEMYRNGEYAEFTLQTVQVFGRMLPEDGWVLCLSQENELPKAEDDQQG